jgi:hypothetical protein
MTFVKGHPVYKSDPNKPKPDKTQKMTEEMLKVQMGKALDGDTTAFKALVEYFKSKTKIDEVIEQKFNPDQLLKVFDEAVRNREQTIKETPLTCIENKEIKNE